MTAVARECLIQNMFYLYLTIIRHSSTQWGTPVLVCKQGQRLLYQINVLYSNETKVISTHQHTTHTHTHTPNSHHTHNTHTH